MIALTPAPFAREPGPFHRSVLRALACMAIAAFITACSLGSSRASTQPRATARSAAQSTWPVGSHVETWAYDDPCNGGAHASGRLVRSWLTYGESNCGPGVAKVRRDCRFRGKRFCYAMQYLDTAWNFNDEQLAVPRVAGERWWLHEPPQNGHARIYSATAHGGYLINQRDPAVRSFFRSYVRRRYNRDDGLLMDWQTPGLSQQLYPSVCGCSTTREIMSDRALQLAHESMSAALTHRNRTPFLQVNNTLPPNPYLPQGLNMLKPSIGVVGWVAEGEPMNFGVLDSWYSTLLDQIAFVATRTSGFVVPLSYGTAGSSDQDRSRRVQEGTMLLGYSPGHLVDWADLEEGSDHLSVWPEEGIYPTEPVQSMRSPRGSGCLAGTGRTCTRGGHRDVQVAPGVYRREFGACYRRRAPFGGCAAIVNTTAAAITVRASWLRGTYGHQITFVGGDVQSHGRLDLSGAGFSPGATQVPAADAILLTR